MRITGKIVYFDWKEYRGQIRGEDNCHYFFLLSDIKNLKSNELDFIVEREATFMPLFSWGYDVQLVPRENGILRWLRAWGILGLDK